MGSGLRRRLVEAVLGQERVDDLAGRQAGREGRRRRIVAYRPQGHQRVGRPVQATEPRLGDEHARLDPDQAGGEGLRVAGQGVDRGRIVSKLTILADLVEARLRGQASVRHPFFATPPARRGHGAPGPEEGRHPRQRDRGEAPAHRVEAPMCVRRCPSVPTEGAGPFAKSGEDRLSRGADGTPDPSAAGGPARAGAGDHQLPRMPRRPSVRAVCDRIGLGRSRRA